MNADQAYLILTDQAHFYAKYGFGCAVLPFSRLLGFLCFVLRVPGACGNIILVPRVFPALFLCFLTFFFLPN